LSDELILLVFFYNKCHSLWNEENNIREKWASKLHHGVVGKTIKIFSSKSLECCLDKDNVSDTNGECSMFLTKVTYQ